MTDRLKLDPDLVPAHTTAATTSIARWVEQHYGIQVQHCHLIRRGLNDNYALRSIDGKHYVVRLYSIRPRGEFNVSFEVSLLVHLDAHGVGVAAPVQTANGCTHVPLQFPEGPRAMALFQHAEGSLPDSLEDFELTGKVLAHIHRVAHDYAGPPSRYTLNGHHLAGQTLEYLRVYPDLDTELLETYHQRVAQLLDELGQVESELTRVVCHGDTHGFNNHVGTDAAGARRAVFFDFDDAGPGFLAYDLSVLPWSYLTRKVLKEPDALLLDRWAHYLCGYRSGGGEISKADMAALPMFVQLRHLWNMGEGIGRLHHWGTSTMPADWLKKQVDVLAAWKGLDLPT
ncbi:phosphotransferase enzyme family protein [Hydrogenophaga sp.]|uniref:phosphotransferase enzyme family protein n=1 Tax=Hydrogenophaga sp. TaxID=1904254 RepID=UPI002734E86B|nr:phosphotransferase [Hydrogenophaga sp.]MDP3885838.1 phosphotransferase [Hydrogenophaga sp.]